MMLRSGRDLLIAQATLIHDQVVDTYDFSTLLIEFGEVGFGLAADFNGDFNVDVYDFAILLVNFGNNCEPTNTSTSVQPSPTKKQSSPPSISRQLLREQGPSN